MLIFIMMAVGLNFVVGYAGLLDLGYVAFYAMGAYTARLVRLARSSRTWTFNLGAVDVYKGSAASTSRSGCCCSWPGSRPRSSAC